MKYLFFTLSLVAFHAHAIKFQKVTGTFDVTPKKVTTTPDKSLVGSFEIKDKTREPASVGPQKSETTTHITELTGSFH